MADSNTIKMGGIIFALVLVGGLGGAGVQQALQSDEPLFKCEEEGKIRNCPNGIKADGKRCYYNESNPYAYDYCSSNWQELTEEDLSSGETTQPERAGNKVRCTAEGCQEI